MVINDELVVNNRKRKDIESDLEENEFPKLVNDTYNYLLNMAIYTLTKEKIDELKKQQDELQTEYNNIKAKSIEDMWREELESLKELLN